MGSVFVDAWNMGRSYHYQEGDPEDHRANLIMDLDYLFSEPWISLNDRDKLRRFRDDIQLVELN